MLKLEQRGFSLLEMTIVLALIGLLGAFVVPNLFKNNRGTQRKEFLASFETLLKDTVLRSVVENKMHQFYIDIEHEIMQIREYDPKSIETNQHKKFKKVEDVEFRTEAQFLKRYSIHNFFINGIDEVTAGNAMLDVFFYVMPDGTSQAVVINFVDQDSDGVEKDVRVSVVINPFYARMSVYETFQTP
ncbi:type II secretion system protein [Candidatus Babeliales bacterium]|nr:type II secretion system protein [Candidatus Babeliales bacterium]MBP9844165.1 type II secretion system protein [Candidatus Babeliales bacterium]